MNIKCIEQHTIELKTVLVRKVGLQYGGQTCSPIENKTNKISVKFMKIFVSTIIKKIRRKD